MLHITRKDNVIKVVETILSFTDAKINTILYDIENKKKKMNNETWREMNTSDIDWVNKYYVPKAKQVKEL